MLRGLNVIWVALMIAGAVLTYAMKDRAGRAADHVMELRREIAREKELLNVLQAEWSVLDQPARLQELVGRYGSYLHLVPLDVRQLASIEEVPDRPIEVPGASLDGMITSGVARSAGARNGLAAAKPIVAKPSTAQAGVAKPRPRILSTQSGANP
ncbi:cell division protein FtsL [Kaistia terrae]|jgi:hypothetical protein|uniref:Cell division protein FtsL n=1 Tax=Kaistia terrae TaxID=537017 RepID=A0ABW0PTG9_9HYPH|nr:hypothetical protein [Kaistia terrae]MCX5578232.1 hypothetical protein [Kaistia terrae]